MANRWFKKGKEGFAGDVNWSTDDIRVVLLSAAYVVNLDTHDFLDDIAAGARIATSANLTGKTLTDGILDAADLTFSSVAGARITQFVVYKWTAVEATSRVLIHGNEGSGFPYTPVGTDIIMEFDNGAAKIAEL